MSNVQGSKLKYWKTIFSPSDGAENIMDILDCDPSPTEFIVINVFFFEMLTSMVPYLTRSFFFKKGESGDMNFKKMLAYVPLPSEVIVSPQLRTCHPLGSISLVIIFVLIT